MTAKDFIKYEGVPVEVVSNLIESGTPGFKVKVARRSPQGALQSMKTLTLEARELFDLDDIMRDYAGGGRFSCQVFDSRETSKRLFNIDLQIDGPPKALSPAAAVAPSIANALRRNEDAPPSTWDVGSAYHGQGQPILAQHTSDEIALRTVDEVREEKKQLQAQIRELEQTRIKERAELDAKLEAMRIDADRRDREAEKERHRAELESLRAEIRSNKDAPKGMSPLEVVAALAPFVPVFTEIVKSRQGGEALATDRQNKMLEAQMQGFKELMNATLARNADSGKGMAEMLKLAVPLAGPLLTAWISSNGPKAQAELLSVQSEHNATSMAMIAQLLEQASQGNEDSPALQLADRLLQGMASVAEAIQKSQNKPSVVQQAAQAIAQQHASAPQTNGVAKRTSGEMTADQILSHPQFPQEMKTPEWHSLMATIHDKDDSDSVAQNLANHIINLDNNEQLPSFLEPIFDKDVGPEATFKRLFGVLPIWTMDQVYARLVIGKTIALLAQDDSGDDAGDEVDETEVDDSTQPTMEN